MTPTPELTTGRLRLRAWTATDRSAFAQLNADPEVMEYLGGVLSRKQSDALVDRIEAEFEARGFGLWAVEVPDSASFIGFVGLMILTFQAAFTPAVEVGWRLARDAWGHGYATEAAKASLAFAFNHAHLDEVVSTTALANVRSQRVMQRIGMRRNPGDDYDYPKFPPGHPLQRHVLYRVRPGDWCTAPEKPSASSAYPRRSRRQLLRALSHASPDALLRVLGASLTSAVYAAYRQGFSDTMH